MKIKLLLSLFALVLLAAASVAQSITITPKKIVYKRPKPISSYKKTFTVTYPKVRGVSLPLAKKIESAISYERVSNLNLKEELGEIQWLEEASYEVNYNKNGVLDITLTMMGSAAYPSDYIKTAVVDLKTGDRMTPKDVFINLPGLAALGRKAQKAEIAKTLKELKAESADVEDPDSLFRDANFTAKNLSEFSVNDAGVTFIYDYGFPHVIQAYKPEGRYSFAWKEIKPFIKPGGLLQRFVR